MSTNVRDGEGLSPRDAENLLRLLEAAPSVRRRYQFFVWLQSHVHALMPHTVALCGAYRRQVRVLSFEAFYGVTLPEELVQALVGPATPFLTAVAREWLARGAAAQLMSLHELPGALGSGTGDGCLALQRLGVGSLLVHGVSRPDRPSEIETLFVFALERAPVSPARLCQHLELLLPHLHSVYLRVRGTERELGMVAPVLRETAARPREATAWNVTDRERQILFWVREGHSNQQIADQLGISALTVKNHIQKILRKMGASNRAHAVSLAIVAHLLPDAGDAGAAP